MVTKKHGVKLNYDVFGVVLNTQEKRVWSAMIDRPSHFQCLATCTGVIVYAKAKDNKLISVHLCIEDRGNYVTVKHILD